MKTIILTIAFQASKIFGVGYFSQHLKSVSQMDQLVTNFAGIQPLDTEILQKYFT